MQFNTLAHSPTSKDCNMGVIEGRYGVCYQVIKKKAVTGVDVYIDTRAVVR